MSERAEPDRPLQLAREALAAERAAARARGMRPGGSARGAPRQPADSRPPSPADQARVAAAERNEPQVAGVIPVSVAGRDGPGGSGRSQIVSSGSPGLDPKPQRDDPTPLSSAIDGLLNAEGWALAVATGSVFGRWGEIVGPELASHTTPERLADGELTVAADSTAWATQVRLLAGELLRRLNRELGDGTVQRVKVRGPGAPTRKPGEWRVRGGRGPRDTYG